MSSSRDQSASAEPCAEPSTENILSMQFSKMNLGLDKPSPALLGMPNELLCLIAQYTTIEPRDFFTFRLVCRRIATATYYDFGESYFRKSKHVVSRANLRILDHISKCDSIRGFVRTVEFAPRRMLQRNLVTAAVPKQGTEELKKQLKFEGSDAVVLRIASALERLPNVERICIDANPRASGVDPQSPVPYSAILSSNQDIYNNYRNQYWMFGKVFAALWSIADRQDWDIELRIMSTKIIHCEHDWNPRTPWPFDLETLDWANVRHRVRALVSRCVTQRLKRTLRVIQLRKMLDQCQNLHSLRLIDEKCVIPFLLPTHWPHLSSLKLTTCKVDDSCLQEFLRYHANNLEVISFHICCLKTKRPPSAQEYPLPPPLTWKKHTDFMPSMPRLRELEFWHLCFRACSWNAEDDRLVKIPNLRNEDGDRFVKISSLLNEQNDKMSVVEVAELVRLRGTNDEISRGLQALLFRPALVPRPIVG